MYLPPLRRYLPVLIHMLLYWLPTQQSNPILATSSSCQEWSDLPTGTTYWRLDDVGELQMIAAEPRGFNASLLVETEKEVNELPSVDLSYNIKYNSTFTSWFQQFKEASTEHPSSKNPKVFNWKLNLTLANFTACQLNRSSSGGDWPQLDTDPLSLLADSEDEAQNRVNLAENKTALAIIITGVVVIIIVSVLALLFWYRRHKAIKRLNSVFIPLKEVDFDYNSTTDQGAFSRVTLASRIKQCETAKFKDAIVRVRWSPNRTSNHSMKIIREKLSKLSLSLLTDIVNGLVHLHEQSILHGRLNTNNCVVDDNWICKVTDFGLDDLLFVDHVEKMRNFIDNEDNVPFTAPEYRIDPMLEPTQQMDVYSFGTIMAEMALGTDVYNESDIPFDMATFQPRLPTVECFNSDTFSTVTSDATIRCYIQLIEDCWSEHDKRPLVPGVKSKLFSIFPRKQKPVDLMMLMFKDYSTQLEALIDQRTADLTAEKQLTDQLLQSMLPKSVVEVLRLGHHAPPEAYSECTIYFSDIVGFTTISSMSTPFEVVELLNKLYSEFDSIIDRYDVYKVETIGDAYMVASGVPRRNGERHAIAIADMSLDLVSNSRSFVIPHMPKEPLKIRVGIHSGPVCAGVVGLKMPRYCLFGDTVNTASRMESNGEEYKIHCSATTHEILERNGGFLFEKRGTIEVKGKGEMQTWWVIDRTRDDLDHDCCPLPVNWKKRKVRSQTQSEELNGESDQLRVESQNSV